MQHVIRDWLKVLKPETVRGQLSPAHLLQHVAYNSQNRRIGHHSVFVALKGARHDGHNYVEEAYNRGCRCFLVSKWVNIPEEHTCQIRVPDTLKALQQIAAWHRRQLSPQNVIAITGSHAKTIIKEWLYVIMSQQCKVAKSPKSFNSQLGVPLSVLQMEGFHDVGIFEAGISKPGEMPAIEQIIQPTIGIFTNIGQPHQANFRDKISKIQEKLQLFTNVTDLVYCRDHQIIHEQTAAARQNGVIKASTKLHDWGFSASAAYRVSELPNGQFQIEHATKGKLTMAIPFQQKAYIENALHCTVVSWVLHLDLDKLQNALKQIRPIPMRLQHRQGIMQSIIVNDSYAADIDSLDVALEYLEQVSGHLPKALLLSDFDEEHLPPKIFIESINQRLQQHHIQAFYGLGPVLYKARKTIHAPTVKVFQDHTELSAYFKNHFQGKVALLLKGARKYQLEALQPLLEEKSHETQLEINLSAIRQNLAFYRSKLKPNTAIMVMVKAHSYGAGSVEVARTLQNEGVAYLSVAYIDEGVELRKHGIHIPIMVLNPQLEGYQKMLDYQLEPEIFSLHTLQQLQAFLSLSPSAEPLRIHVNIDTGMHRLGFAPEEWPMLMQQLEEGNAKLEIASIYSHLAASEDPAQDAFTSAQIQQFKEVGNALEKQLGRPLCKHICNTAGILRHPEAHMDMVRLGLGLYGIDTSASAHQQLQPALVFRTSITQIKEVDAGDSVGYGRAFTAEKKSRIATIPVGYADGWPRKLGNGQGSVQVKGQKVKTVGHICMDMCMVNITGIDAQEGDEVQLFADSESLQNIANALGTIPYEVLAAISSRVKRVYIEE